MFYLPHKILSNPNSDPKYLTALQDVATTDILCGWWLLFFLVPSCDHRFPQIRTNGSHRMWAERDLWALVTTKWPLMPGTAIGLKWMLNIWCEYKLRGLNRVADDSWLDWKEWSKDGILIERPHRSRSTRRSLYVYIHFLHEYSRKCGGRGWKVTGRKYSGLKSSQYPTEDWSLWLLYLLKLRCISRHWSGTGMLNKCWTRTGIR